MKPERLLILRPDNIGDVLLFSGALKHLRELYPTAQISLALQSHVTNMLEGCPHIDRCLSVEELTWWGRLRRWERSFGPRGERTVRDLNRLWNRARPPYDLVLYPVKSPQPAHLGILRELAAPECIGIVGCTLGSGRYPAELQPERLFSRALDVSALDPWRHELLTTLDFLRLLGSPVSRLEEIGPQFWLSEPLAFPLREGEGETVIGIFPGASAKEKSWSPENYRRLAQCLAFSPSWVILGGPAEERVSREVESALRRGGERKVANLAGRTSLQQLIHCIGRCDLLIGMETCGLHMAVAAGVPSVGIVGGWHFGRFFPWGDRERHIFLTRQKECFHCGIPCSPESVPCVAEVAPEEVAAAVQRLLTQVEVGT